MHCTAMQCTWLKYVLVKDVVPVLDFRCAMPRRSIREGALIAQCGRGLRAGNS